MDLSHSIKNQMQAYMAWKMYRDGVKVRKISSRLNTDLTSTKNMLWMLGDYPRNSRFRHSSEVNPIKLSLIEKFG